MDTASLPMGGNQSAADSQPAVAGGDVLVAIPVLNEEAHIEACIRSLMSGDSRLAAADFVVVDGGSSDATRAIVERLGREFSNLRLMVNPRKLQSAAVNLASEGAKDKQRILVRCDAHAVYPPGYVMKVADSLVQRGCASVVVPMDAMGEGCFQRANAWVVDTPFGSGGSQHRGGRKSGYVDHGHHAGFDLKIFATAGGYDETFSHNEDAEFDARLRKIGGKIFLDADIRLGYFPRASLRALAKQYFNYGKGRARTLMKHGERPRLRQMIPPATLVACLAGLAIAPLNPVALVLPGGYVAALALVSAGMAVKHKSACGLLAGLASAGMHMPWSAGFFWQMAKGQRP
ncbi:MAG TPA: glycosyltransferase family 2 protein [Hyphomonadaceae bacterium]|nr:glycosyltransferase family 2 protein [Hyphomonadaceae bacterium]